MAKAKSTKARRAVLLKWIEYWIGRTCVTLLHYIPLPIAYYLGRCIGWLAWKTFRSRRKIVTQNLIVVNDYMAENAPPQNLHQQVREVFLRNGANMACSLRFTRMSSATVKRHIEMEGVEYLQAALSQKKGAMILLAHMGPWEILPHLPYLFGEDIRMGAMYRPMNNPYFDDWFKSVREQKGTQLFSRKDGFHKPVDFLRSGGMFGVLADQRMRQGVRAPFFGQDVTTNPLPGLFQRRSGAVALGLSIATIKPLKWKIKMFPVSYPDNKEARTRDNEAAISNQAIEKILSESILDGFWLRKGF